MAPTHTTEAGLESLIADVVTGAVDVTAAAKAMAVDAGEAYAEASADEEEPLSMAAEGEAEYGEEEV